MTDIGQIEREAVGSIWTQSRAMEHLIALCDGFGGRFAGSSLELQAGDYLLQHLQALGLDHVHAEPFHYLGWERGPSSLALVSPVERPLDAVGLPGSPPHELTANLVSVGDGEEEEYVRVGDRLRGMVALCNAESQRPGGRASSHRRAKYLRAVAAGASGFLYVSQNPGMLAVTGGLASAAAAPIPGYGLSYETGAALERLLSRGAVTVRLQGEHRLPEVISRNLVADLPGRGEQGGVVVVGAHYDGHDISQAAADNGSGVVSVLEIARVLAPYRGQFARTVRFLFFGSEEMGLIGAWRYVRLHRGAASSMACMLNLDTVVAGAPGGLRVHCGNSPDLASLVRAAAQQGVDVEVDEQLSTASDHFPFSTLGIPVATVGATTGRTGLVGRGWGHTTADTVDKVEPSALRHAAAVGTQLLLRLAQAETLPPHTTAEEVRHLLQRTGAVGAAERGSRLELRD